MEKSLERMAEADLILLVLDQSKPPPELPESVRKNLNKDSTLIVANKSDLTAGAVPLPNFTDFETIATSALTGAGFDDLGLALQKRADAFHVELGNDLIAINARHADALARANTCLEQASAQLMAGEPIELIASELRGSLAAYGEISGKIDNERMLDHLFASFCIGK
jgi:tRNA modification GTPase